MQVESMKCRLKPPGTKRLKLKCDTLPSSSAFKFKFNLRRYTEVAPQEPPECPCGAGQALVRTAR